MSDLKYTQDHEWVLREGDLGTVGITEYAQGQLGDVVYVELPSPDTDVVAGGEIAIVESVKAASEVYSPVSGLVVEVNEELRDKPALVNESAEGDGWFFKIKLADVTELDGLMDKDAYDKFVGGLK
ncbi:MAG: glycine cleavage system protein GcvH [Alphaproteobacteria bacterium]|nr:glycine cleavage system protein GcvH [Alphaproteobacteria bacterium]